MNTSWDQRKKIVLRDVIQSLKLITPTQPPKELSKIFDGTLSEAANHFKDDSSLKYKK